MRFDNGERRTSSIETSELVVKVCQKDIEDSMCLYDVSITG